MIVIKQKTKKMEKLISWVEIPAVDFERAIDFYTKTLNIDFNMVNCGNEKMACFSTGEGAISMAPNFKPSQNGLLVSFNTDKKLDDALKTVELIGGQVIQAKTKIEAEGRDYFALIIDSEGNKIGLYGE